MAPAFSQIISKAMEALVRLVHHLFGRGNLASDLESGTGASGRKANGSPVKTEVVPKADVAMFKPDLAGVPALVLSSMTISAVMVPAAPIEVPRVVISRTFVIPTIVITPPPVEVGDVVSQCKEDEDKSGNGVLKEVYMARAPLREVTNAVKRVHGKAVSARKLRSKDRENLREHPNVPRRPQLYQAPPRLRHTPLVATAPTPVPSVPVPAPVASPERVVADPDTVAHPASSAWDLEKARRLEEARKFSEQVKAHRRLSLPPPSPPPSSPAASPPLVRRASAPARLSLQERLQRVCVAAPIVPAAPAVPVAPLWGDEHVSFVVDDDEDHTEAELSKPVTPARHENVASVPALHDTSLPALSPSSTSSSGSITSVLEALEAEFRSSAWLALRGLADHEAGRSGNGGDSNRASYWSDVISFEDYA
ncbi:hypothetical protein FB451DRAFT_1398317 [Mycena latifolia]|nr:hypothetical protein FB451DRAFT_1398317 [Mycena latifolia]